MQENGTHKGHDPRRGNPEPDEGHSSEREIMEEEIPPHFMVLKVAPYFLGKRLERPLEIFLSTNVDLRRKRRHSS